MRYADDSCRSALLQRLLPLREREPYSAALDMRFASKTQPDPNPLLHYVRFRANATRTGTSVRTAVTASAIRWAPYAYSLPSFEINLIGTPIHGEYLAKK